MPRRTINQIMGRGGKRAGAGRKKGSLDKYSKQTVMRAHEGGQHPFDYLLEMMRNESEHPKMRLHAAGLALPYCLPKLSHSTVEVESELQNLSLAEKIALASNLRSRILEHKPNAKIPKLPINGSAKRV
jgi:hypothetical protein